MDTQTQAAEGNGSNNQTRASLLWAWVKNNLLLVLTIGAIVVGMVLGCVLRYAEFSEDTIMIIAFPGDLLKRMFYMLYLPLIVSSLVSGLENMDVQSTGRMGLYAGCYYFSTTLLSTGTGLAISLIIHPGQYTAKEKAAAPTNSGSKLSTMDTVMDSVRNMFPENLIQAMFESLKTEFVREDRLYITGSEVDLNWNRIQNQTVTLEADNGTVLGTEVHFYKMVRAFQYHPGSNLMGLMVFFAAFGLICGKFGRNAETMIRFFVGLNKVVTRLLYCCMWYSPIGMASFIMAKLLPIPDIYGFAAQLAKFVLTVVFGLVVHGFGTLPLIYFVVTRKNPILFFKGLLQAFFTAIGTASSATTLPFTFRCLEENNHIDRRVTRFMLPLATTINRDGTSLFKICAVIFIAQLNGIEFSISQVFFVSIAAMVGASIPSGGIITLLLVLNIMGLPVDDVLLIMPVDFLLDRFRTSINVLGDAYGTGVVDHLCKSEFDKLDAKHKVELEEETQPTPINLATNTDSNITESELVDRRGTSLHPRRPYSETEV